MKEAFDRLPAVDLLVYFAMAMNIITPKQILYPADEHMKYLSDTINVQRYKKYREKMDAIYAKQRGGTGRYVHDFLVYFNRILVYPDGTTSILPLPAVEPSYLLMKHWATKVLNVSDEVLQKVESCFVLPYCCEVQLQGSFESHFRTFIKPVYVLYYIYYGIYFLYIFYIFLIYSAYIVNILLIKKPKE